MNRWDPLWIILILIVAGALWFLLLGRTADHPVAEIYYDNQLIDSIDLATAKPRRFSYPQDPHVVFEIFPDHRIAFVASDCPDKVCIHAGRLMLPGDAAACLPNHFMLKIRQGEKAPADKAVPDIVQ